MQKQYIPIPLHFVDIGGGIPLVFLHGFPFSGAIWREQQKAFAGLYRLIIPDLRGHGGSASTAGVYEMDLMAADVFNLLDQLKIDKAIWIGHSMGGYVALAGYHMKPERFRALGLIGSQTSADDSVARERRSQLVEKVLQAGVRGAQVVTDAMIGRLFAQGITPDPELVEELTRLMLKADPTGIVGTLKGMAARPDSTPLLPEMDIPFLALTGAKDVIIPPERAERMGEVAQTPTVIVVDDAGHMPMLEQPYATTEALRQFLESVQR